MKSNISFSFWSSGMLLNMGRLCLSRMSKSSSTHRYSKTLNPLEMILILANISVLIRSNNNQILMVISFFKDTPLAPANTASTTIMVTIVDVDNRPPWFQPCTEHEIGGALICQSSGYTGKVVLNEQQVRHFHYLEGPALIQNHQLTNLDGVKQCDFA